MGTKNWRSSRSCRACSNAEPDEPMFILLGRDPSAAQLVEDWARFRQADIERGAKPASDIAMVVEARECAKAMREFHLLRKSKR